MNLSWIHIDMPTEDPQPEEQEILPEIVLDESADGFVPDDDPPAPEEPPEEEQEVVVQPELPPPPEQDSIFQTGKPVKKKRQVSEKQRAHLDRIRAKALERKKEKASERAKARASSKVAASPAPGPSSPEQQPPPAPKVEPVPPKYLTHDDVDSILSRYDERRQKRKETKRKEAQAQQLVQTHLQADDVWEQCFR
eukprot:COSAG04_NODE_1154_length_8051_cov_26.213531_5_plen_195_part_00